MSYANLHYAEVYLSIVWAIGLIYTVWFPLLVGSDHFYTLIGSSKSVSIDSKSSSL